MSARHKVKKNKLLASYEAQLEAEYQGNLRRVREFDLMVCMLAVHEALGVGPGRADRVLLAYLDERRKLPRDVLGDIDGNNDQEAVYSRAKLAQRIYKIFGPEKWKLYKDLFPFVAEYLTIEPGGESNGKK